MLLWIETHLLFKTILSDGYNYHQFTDEEIEAQCNLVKVTQLLSGTARTQTLAAL